jgi:hypothetical protein
MHLLYSDENVYAFKCAFYDRFNNIATQIAMHVILDVTKKIGSSL